jgi:hypothetical protein
MTLLEGVIGVALLLSADEIRFRLPSPPLTLSSVHLVGKVERDARAESIRAHVS